MRRGSIGLGLLALGLAAGCGNDAGPAMPIDPAVLYTQMCTRCHGQDGRGDAVLMKTMPTLRPFSDPEVRARLRTDDIERIIMTGKNQMPSFGAQLSGPKIQAVAGHVKRLGLK
jgi:mono/diheme cytochrome c family protein